MIHVGCPPYIRIWQKAELWENCHAAFCHRCLRGWTVMESDNEFEKKKGMFHVKHFCSVRETLLNECIKTVLSGGTECPLDRVVVLRRRRWMLLMWFAVGGDFVCEIFSCVGWWKWNWKNVSREALEVGDWGEKMMVWIRFTSEFPWMTWRGVGELLRKWVKRDEWKKCDWNVR